MRNILLIIRREYLSRVRKRSFIIMSLLGPIIMACVGIASVYLSIDEAEDQRVLVVDENYPLFATIESSELIQYVISDADLDEALATFETSEYTALLHINKNYYKTHSGQLYFKKQPSFRVQRAIERTIQLKGEEFKLSEFNISESDYRRIKQPFEMQAFQYDSVSKTAEEADMLPAVVGIVFSILIYMFIFMYSVQVMRGVIEEKTSRIVEVMISTVKPFHLMLGKIVGIAAVGLTQFMIWITLSFTLLGIGQYALLSQYDSASVFENATMTDQMQKDMSEEMQDKTIKYSSEDNILASISKVNFPLMIGLFLFYFLGGYLLYSAMMAAVGSAVDNDTDTQQFIVPITFPLILGYIASFILFSNPNSPIGFWLSIIPFTSPIVMLVRIPFNNVEIWELALSMSLLVIAFVGMVWLAAKVYRTGILMYGKKPTLREMIKWIKY
jgi:ABC-2 type transport system permease protein